MPNENTKKSSLEALKGELKNLQAKIDTYEKPKRFEVSELYAWRSSERVFIPRNRKWFIYLFSLVLLIILVLLFIQEFIIIAPIAAIGFVAYILATVPPHEVEHRITTEGINTAGHSFLWNELNDFWLTKKGEETVINIETYLNYPRRINLILGEADLEEIKEILIQYLPFREIPKTNIFEKAFDQILNSFHKFAS